jgi:hypothetical protein
MLSNPINTIFTEKLTVTKLTMKFPAFHATGSFITVLRAASQLALHEPHDSNQLPMRVHLQV